jgi:hypothetical protein
MSKDQYYSNLFRWLSIAMLPIAILEIVMFIASIVHIKNIPIWAIFPSIFLSVLIIFLTLFALLIFVLLSKDYANNVREAEERRSEEEQSTYRNCFRNPCRSVPDFLQWFSMLRFVSDSSIFSGAVVPDKRVNDLGVQKVEVNRAIVVRL